MFVVTLHKEKNEYIIYSGYILYLKRYTQNIHSILQWYQIILDAN